MAASQSPVARVNRELARQGRDERVVRGRGYYWLMGGDAVKLSESGFYGLGARMLQRTTADYLLLAGEVRDKLAELGVVVVFDL